MTIFGGEIKDITLYGKKGILEVKTLSGDVIIYLYKNEVNGLSWKEISKIKIGTRVDIIDCKIIEDEYVAFDIKL
jgi:hypothetical protein